MARQSDQELIAGVIRRDAAAFEALFACYQEPIRRHLTRMVRDATAADDLLQEVFLRVWMHAEQWDGRGAVKAWLYRIATNLALNYLRATARRRQEPLVIPAEPEDENPAPGWLIDASALGPDAVLELAEQRDLLRRMVDELPEEKREVFRMVREAEMDIGEVAEELGIPEGTVKSRLHYATKQLIRQWNSMGKV